MQGGTTNTFVVIVVVELVLVVSFDAPVPRLHVFVPQPIDPASSGSGDAVVTRVIPACSAVLLAQYLLVSQAFPYLVLYFVDLVFQPLPAFSSDSLSSSSSSRPPYAPNPDPNFFIRLWSEKTRAKTIGINVSNTEELICRRVWDCNRVER